MTEFNRYEVENALWAINGYWSTTPEEDYKIRNGDSATLETVFNRSRDQWLRAMQRSAECINAMSAEGYLNQYPMAR